MQTVETMVNAEKIIPVVPRGKVFGNHSLIINSGKIVDIIPTDKAALKYQAKSTINYRSSIIMPGLINLYDSPIMHGVTCSFKNYSSVNLSGVKKAGIRAVFGTKPDSNILENISKEKITLIITPNLADMLEPETAKVITDVCFNKNLKLMLPLHASSQEIVESHIKYSKSTIARIAELGIIQKDLIALHMVHLDNNDYKILKNTNCNILACPKLNLQNGSGICNIEKLQAIGLNVAIASAKDLLAELRDAALLNKGLNSNPELSSASEAIEMITINPAKAIGMDNLIGSLEIGKYADFIVWNTNSLNSYPQHDPIAQVVFAGNSGQIKDVWVEGVKIAR